MIQVPRPVFIIFVAIAMASLSGCGNSKQPADEVPAHINEARERFGDRFECEPNDPDDYVLCAYRPDTTAMNPLPRVAFFVFDSQAQEVVMEQAQVAGAVKWVSDYELEMTLTPGIVTQDGRGAPTYKIDVRSGDRIRLDGADGIPK